VVPPRTGAGRGPAAQAASRRSARSASSSGSSGRVGPADAAVLGGLCPARRPGSRRGSAASRVPPACRRSVRRSRAEPSRCTTESPPGRSADSPGRWGAPNGWNSYRKARATGGPYPRSWSCLRGRCRSRAARRRGDADGADRPAKPLVHPQSSVAVQDPVRPARRSRRSTGPAGRLRPCRITHRTTKVGQSVLDRAN